MTRRIRFTCPICDEGFIAELHPPDGESCIVNAWCGRMHGRQVPMVSEDVEDDEAE